MKHRLLQTLGICKKAGKLIQGFDPSAQAIKSGQAGILLTAADLSPKSEKEIRRIADAHGLETCRAPVTMDEIWSLTGKRAGILAVTDAGLAHTVKGAICRANEED